MMPLLLILLAVTVAAGLWLLWQRNRLRRDIARLRRSLEENTVATAASLADTRRDHERLSAVLSAMSEGVVAVDANQRLILCNAASRELLRIGVEQPVGQYLWEVVRLPELEPAVAEALRLGQVIRRTIGPVAGRHLDVSLCPIQSTAGSGGLVLVAHDATAAVRYQELRKEFVANVSHDLRTPISVIKGFAETLRDGALRDPVRGPKYLESIERSADQLTNLVRDLLELSQLEANAVPPATPVDLAAVARHAAEMLAPAAASRKQRFDIRIGDVPAVVLGDDRQLERAVSNLLDNAIKYTPDDGSVSLSLDIVDREVTIAVTDTGAGIPAADLPRIFERFYRVDRSRSRQMGGTGLGLSIVKHIVGAHRGRIEVQSTLGIGSTFRVHLPLAPAEDATTHLPYLLAQKCR